MSLQKALEAVRQGAKSKASTKRLHLDYLETYAGLSEPVSLDHASIFLDYLRKARQASAAQDVNLSRWERDCKHHPGFAKFRSQILEGSDLQKASSREVTKIYQNLRRMNLHDDARQMWPHVARLLGGRLPRDDLLRIWAVCPPERLPELDAAMAKALDSGQAAKMWELLSALSRSGGLPKGSQTLKASLRRLTHLVEDTNVSPEDLATLLYRLHIASSQQGSHDLTRSIVKIKEELVKRSPEVKVETVCRMLPALHMGDELWPKLRDQLLQNTKIPLENCLDILEFLRQKEGNAASAEPKLQGFVRRRLELLLSTGQALPRDLASITRRLELVTPSKKLCQALLNMAINLRQDLYPAVLWRFFVRTGEAGLAEHRQLTAKFHRISEVLEEHGIQRDKMSLPEMLKSARAMRQNQVKMPKCLEQIAQIYLDTLRHAQRHVGSAEVDPTLDVKTTSLEVDPAAEATEAKEEEGQADSQPPEEVTEGRTTLHEDAKPLEDEVTVSPDARKLLLGEVQHLVLLLWGEFERLDIEHPELKAAALALCEAENCRLNTRHLADCLIELADVLSSEAKGKLRQRLPLNEVSDPELLQYLVRFSADLETFAMVFEELNQRLLAEKLQVASDEDRSALVQCLRQLRAGAAARAAEEVVPELMGKVAKLLLQHLPSQKSPQDLRRSAQILSETSSTLVKLDVALAESFRPLLQKGLRLLLEAESLSMSEEELSELLYSLVATRAFARGAVPFDCLALAWRLAVRQQHVVTSPECRAKLWAFCLAAQHLSSASVWASLRLVPDAEVLDTSVFTTKVEDRRLPSLPLEPAPEELLLSFRAALSSAVPGEIGEAKYQVPGTPFLLDFALERLRLALLLVRPQLCAAQGAQGPAQLNGFGQLLEAVLQAHGWRLLWAWPQEWSGASTEDLAEALRHAIDSPSSREIRPARGQAAEGPEGPEGTGVTEAETAAPV